MNSNKNYIQITDIVNSVLEKISNEESKVSVEIKQKVKSADKDFEITHREYMAMCLEAGDDTIGKIKAYIIRNVRLDCGLYFGSLSETSERTNVSRRTVVKVFNALQQKDLIRKYKDGVWAIHPKYLRKGGGGKYLGLLRFYNSLPKKDDTRDDDSELLEKIKKIH